MDWNSSVKNWSRVRFPPRSPGFVYMFGSKEQFWGSKKVESFGITYFPATFAIFLYYNLPIPTSILSYILTELFTVFCQSTFYNLV